MVVLTNEFTTASKDRTDSLTSVKRISINDLQDIRGILENVRT